MSGQSAIIMIKVYEYGTGCEVAESLSIGE